MHAVPSAKSIKLSIVSVVPKPAGPALKNAAVWPGSAKPNGQAHHRAELRHQAGAALFTLNFYPFRRSATVPLLCRAPA